jgi:hypothetical protein
MLRFILEKRNYATVLYLRKETIPTKTTVILSEGLSPLAPDWYRESRDAVRWS